MTGSKTGGCMCGAVRFTATDVPSRIGACHCETCRRWTGSALIGVAVPAAGVSWEGAEKIATLQSSDWAARSFCSACGSPLYYRITLDGPMSDTLQMPLGLFDDASGFTFDSEIFIDCKPDSFAYAGSGRSVLTRAEVMAKYGVTLK